MAKDTLLTRASKWSLHKVLLRQWVSTVRELVLFTSSVLTRTLLIEFWVKSRSLSDPTTHLLPFMVQELLEEFLLTQKTENNGWRNWRLLLTEWTQWELNWKKLLLKLELQEIGTTSLNKLECSLSQDWTKSRVRLWFQSTTFIWLVMEEFQ